MRIYQLLWIFLLYSVLGWCAEVIFQATRRGKFINRGFLNGPVCPIYGVGVALIAAALTPLSDRLWALFLGGMALTSALEFLTGFLLEKLFDDKWWDYSKEPFNLMGYICLRFSLAWGVACVVVVDRVLPLTLRFINWLPHTLGVVLLSICLSLLAADAAVTLHTTLKLRRRLRALEDIGHALHTMSDRLGEPMADSAIDIQKKLAEGRQEWAEKHPEAEQRLRGTLARSSETAESLRARRQRLAAGSGRMERRLLNAFPRLQTGKYRESTRRLRQAWRAKRESKKSSR